MTMVRLAPESTTVTIQGNTTVTGTVTIQGTSTAVITGGVAITTNAPIITSTGYNYANLEVKTSGSIQAATSIAAKRVRVLGMVVGAVTSCKFYFQSGTTAALGDVVFGNSTAAYKVQAGGGYVLPTDAQGAGYFQSTAGAGLVFHSSGSTAQMTLNLVYIYV